MKKIKILIIGSNSYNNKLKLKNFIFKFKRKFKSISNDSYQIASFSGKYGANKWIKKYCIEFGLNYGEFNPYHEHVNLYSIMPEYLFGKPYHYKNIIIRDSHAIKWADYIFIFIDNKKDLEYFDKIIKYSKKHNKKIKILK